METRTAHNSRAFILSSLNCDFPRKFSSLLGHGAKTASYVGVFYFDKLYFCCYIL